MIGQTLSRYRILRELGRGGMGEVYLAEDETLKRRVALKVLPAELAADPGRLRRFRREAEALAALDHPNIVTVHSVEEDQGVHFLTMSFVEGETLEETLAAGPADLEAFFPVAVGVADGLAAAHAEGVVHRDLKPRNIMIGPGERVRILDFGLAKVAAGPDGPEPEASTELTAPGGALMGTVRYMSPEQVRAEAADARSDVFSLGMILYEMATGARPFSGEGPAEVMSSILRDTPAAPTRLRPELPRHLGRIILQCLEKDPARRFQTAVDVRNQLESLHRELEGERLLRTAAPVVGAGAERARAEPAGAERAGARQPDAPPSSLAVLPLANLSGDPAQDYFADGMTEALITDLAKVSALSVTSRTSAFRYRDTRKSVPEIARDLGVEGIVEGSVLRDGSRVRIIAQLIDARVDRHLWAEEYEREIEDVISLQREVARAIAAEVDAQLTASEKDRLADTDRVHPDAYDAYLKGRSHWYRFLPGDTDRAARYFERALELDPDFALAYTGLADVWGWRASWGLLPPGEVAPRLRELTRKALELDPDHARTQAMLAKTRLYLEHDWKGAEAAFDRALELGPNDTDIYWESAVFLCAMGRAEEALAKARRGIELDPLNSFGELVEGLGFWNSEPARIEGAVERLRRALPLLPARLSLWSLYASTGRHERALAEATGFYESVDDRRTVQALEGAWREGAGGDAGTAYRAAMRAGGEALETRADSDHVQPTQVARFWLQADEPARALDWLESALDERDFYVVYLDLAEWRSLRSEPRFQELHRRLDLPEG